MLTVLHGHSLTKLREMASESVHCFVTSPPFWGLRDYGVPAQVWGGGDMDCEHMWGDEIRTPWANSVSGPNGANKNGPHSRHQPKTTGPFCQKCDAWFGHLGLEPNPELYVRNLVTVLREARRVLRSDGTLWLNLGDSYATGAGSVGDCPGGGAQGERWKRGVSYNGRGEIQGSRGGSAKQPHNGAPIGPLIQPNRLPIPGLKPKDLVGIPWMVAFALRADGWWLRSDIIWAKPNPMPESVTDRPTKAHEYLFLLTKSERYFYDAPAIAEPSSYYDPRLDNPNWEPSRRDRDQLGQPSRGGGPLNKRSQRDNFKRENSKRATSMVGHNQGTHRSDRKESDYDLGTRNKRSVWTITTKPYAEAHFATFPPELPKLCILAGTSAQGCCSKCGAPWERIVELGEPDLEHQRACGGDLNGEYNGIATKDFMAAKAQDASEVKARILRGMVERKTTGWQPTCECKEEKVIPCTVCDPFGGSGTTGEVALELGRSAILIELNEKYLPLIDRRCDVTPGLALA